MRRQDLSPTVRRAQIIGSGFLFSKLKTLKWPAVERLVQRLDEEVQDYLYIFAQERAAVVMYGREDAVLPSISRAEMEKQAAK